VEVEIVVQPDVEGRSLVEKNPKETGVLENTIQR
jgi:hypothetical protein